MAELILGGARSGKSAYAEKQALESGLEVIYVATAQIRDEEMGRRVAHHRLQRPGAWQTVEVVLDLPGTLQALAAPGRCILVDCLTLWLTTLVCAEPVSARFEQGEACPEVQEVVGTLLRELPRLPGRVLLVSNELGWGVVPANALSRAFVDEQGRLNQRVAAVCDRVTLIAAGLPLLLKGTP